MLYRVLFKCPRGWFPGADTRVTCAGSKLSDLIDSASSRSRDQPKGQNGFWYYALRDAFRLVACDISINGVFLAFEGPTKNRHLRFVTSSLGFFRTVKAWNNVVGCNCSPLDWYSWYILCSEIVLGNRKAKMWFCEPHWYGDVLRPGEV